MSVSPTFDEAASGAHDAEAVLRTIEASAAVRRRHHLFVWMQSYLAVLVPHRIAVCGAYSRASRGLVFEGFSSLVLPDRLLDALTHADTPGLQALVDAWVQQGGRAHSVGLTAQSPLTALRDFGISEILVHGVARPQRPRELESLFLLMAPQQSTDPRAVRRLDLLLPHLHAAYLRVRAVEQSLGSDPSASNPAHTRSAGGVQLSTRELQILALMRHGLSNQRIGEQLTISGLTVKNHAQNIFRKLGASNRAQAVAHAMSRHWLTDDDAPPAGPW